MDKSKIRSILTLGCFAFSISAFNISNVFADTFTLRNDMTGQRYFCGQNGSVPLPTDPRCQQTVANFCNQNTTYSQNICYTKAGSACQGAPIGFDRCVFDTFQYCSSNTTYSNNECFDNALSSCRGSSQSMLNLLEAVKKTAILKADLTR